MRYINRTMGLTAALTLSLAGIGATAAHADAGPATVAPSALVLTIADGTNPNTAPVNRAVTLRCSPNVGGDHPDSYQACGELGAVNGNFGALATNASRRICPMIWKPEVVTAQGVWQGQRIAYSKTFPNDCIRKSSSEFVFNF